MHVNKEMENQANIDFSAQQALEMAQAKAHIEDAQLHHLQQNEECLSLCRMAEDIACSRIPLPDVEEELAAFYRARRIRLFKRATITAVVTMAAAIALFLILRPTRLEPAPKTAGLLIVFKANPKQGHAMLEIPAEKRQIDVAETNVTPPPSIAALSPGQVVYAPSTTASPYSKDAIATTHRMVVPRGETFKVVLSDGSAVFLNTDSKLVYPERFAGKERRVHLVGEAYFKIAPDKRHPFVVDAGGMEAKVLGTEFDLRAYPDAPTAVTLVEGALNVRSTASGATKNIVPGQRASLSDNGRLSTQTVDTDQYTYWKEGLFYFDGCSLEYIMREIGRWYNVGIVFRTPHIPQMSLHFVGERSKPLAYTIRLLNQLGKVKVSYKNGSLLVD